MSIAQGSVQCSATACASLDYHAAPSEWIPVSNGCGFPIHCEFPTVASRSLFGKSSPGESIHGVTW